MERLSNERLIWRILMWLRKPLINIQKQKEKREKKTEKERIHIDEIMHGQRAIKHQSIQLAPEAKSHPLHIV